MKDRRIRTTKDIEEGGEGWEGCSGRGTRKDRGRGTTKEIRMQKKGTRKERGRGGRSAGREEKCRGCQGKPIEGCSGRGIRKDAEEGGEGRD